MTAIQKMNENPKCPECNSTDTAYIVYGLIRDYGDVYSRYNCNITFGGCVIKVNSPNWQCNNCKNRWTTDSKVKFDANKDDKITKSSNTPIPAEKKSDIKVNFGKKSTNQFFNNLYDFTDDSKQKNDL